MAVQIQQFSCTIPAGTQTDNLEIFDLGLGVFETQWVEIEIPPGPKGTVGFYLALSAQQVIPFQAGQFIISDNRVIHWDLEGYPNSGAWNLYAYNLGANPHTIYVTFGLQLVAPPANATSALYVPAGAIQASASA
jgi:hypothetical protein